MLTGGRSTGRASEASMSDGQLPTTVISNATSGNHLPAALEHGTPERARAYWVALTAWIIQNRVVLAALSCMIAGILLVIVAAGMSPYATTAATFSIALISLSIIATKQCRASFWSYVDYFWVSATVVSVFIAITGNTTSRNLRTLADARHQFRNSISDVIFQLDETIDRSCSADPMGIGSGPGDLYSCPRMRHMLFQAQGDFRREILQEVDSIQMPQNWASDFCMKEFVPGHEQWNIASEKGPLCGPMHEFDAAQKKIAVALDVYNTNRTFLDKAAQDGTIRYWFYFYAMLAGLRLSRVTADILRTRKPVAPAR